MVASDTGSHAAAKRSARGQLTLDRNYYTSSAVFRAELDQFFHKGWFYLGHCASDRAPGSFRTEVVDGEHLLVVESSSGPRVFMNLCRHRGTLLCHKQHGKLPGSIACPYHAWTYSYDGDLVAAPEMDTVPGFDRSQLPLLDVPMTLEHRLLFTSLGEAAPGEAAPITKLHNRLAAWRTDELSDCQRLSYEVRANWKLIIQNFSECFHCPTAHPGLHRLTHYLDTFNDLEEGSVLGGPMGLRPGIETMSKGGRLCGHLLPSNEEDQRRVYYYSVFPNLLLSLHPDYVVTYRLLPRASDRTRIDCEFLFLTGQERAAVEPAVEFWDRTNREDWALSERAQQGVTSRRYQPGPYSDLESGLAAWDRYYLEKLDLS